MCFRLSVTSPCDCNWQFLFSEVGHFFTHCRPLNSPPWGTVCFCSLAAKLSSKLLSLSWGSQNFVQFSSNLLSVFRWSVALTEQVDSKNVFSLWVLTENDYTFSWMLPRLFPKTITEVILIVSLHILKHTVAYSLQSINPKLLETSFLWASLGLIRTIWSLLGTAKSERKSRVKHRPSDSKLQLNVKPRKARTNVSLSGWELFLCFHGRWWWDYFYAWAHFAVAAGS